MTIGLLSIMLNERDHAAGWIESVRTFPATFDRILVVDGGSEDGTADILRAAGIDVISRKFENHFADQRNFGCEQLGTDWILELDADEFGSSPLLGGLRDIIRDAEVARMDCVGLPRLNFIDGLLVAGPEWSQGASHLDYQYRLHRKVCRWRGSVHEEITNYRARYELQIKHGHFLIHDKSSARYKSRNDYYKTIRP